MKKLVKKRKRDLHTAIRVVHLIEQLRLVCFVKSTKFAIARLKFYSLIGVRFKCRHATFSSPQTAAHFRTTSFPNVLSEPCCKKQNRPLNGPKKVNKLVFQKHCFFVLLMARKRSLRASE